MLEELDMPRSSSRFAAVLLSVGLAGCASTAWFPNRSESVSRRLDSLRQTFFLPETDVLAEFQNKDENVKRAYRDHVVHGRLLALDLQYGLFKEAFYREGFVDNFSVDILGVADGMAGAVTSGVDAIVSTLSGGISGAGPSLNKNLYYECTLPALVALMEAKRDEVRADILKGPTLDATAYPLGSALADLERYLHAGSIPGAIVAVTEIAGETEAEANARERAEGSSARVDNLWAMRCAHPRAPR